jgi:hypothetical protein
MPDSSNSKYRQCNSPATTHYFLMISIFEYDAWTKMNCEMLDAPFDPEEVSGQLLIDYSNSGLLLTRCRAAASPHLPLRHIKRLVRDVDSRVRMHLASNPNIPSDVLEMLLRDSNKDVVFLASVSPNLDPKVLASFLKNPPKGVMSRLLDGQFNILASWVLTDQHLGILWEYCRDNSNFIFLKYLYADDRAPSWLKAMIFTHLEKYHPKPISQW